jgi:hypothetical protein
MRLEKLLCNCVSRGMLIHEYVEFVFGVGGGREAGGGGGGGGAGSGSVDSRQRRVRSRIYFVGLHVMSASQSL